MEISSGPIGSCSKENQKIYLEWFNFADSDGDGRITGSDAIKFFGMSNLSRQDLKQVWAIADSKRQGYLGFNEFISAMQLVSLAQAGHEITNDLLNSNADFENLKPPSMEGLDALIAKKKRSSKASDPDINGSPPMQTSPSVNWFFFKIIKKVVPNLTGVYLFLNASDCIKGIVKTHYKYEFLLVPLSAVTSIIDGLKRLYIQKLKPLEVTYHFNDFVSPLLTNSDFDAKPMVMLLGQYSTGKTTFIKHLLKSGYPGELSLSNPSSLPPKINVTNIPFPFIYSFFFLVLLQELILDPSQQLTDLLLLCLVLMKGVYRATLWQSKQICPLMDSQLLELHFCQNLNVLKCLILCWSILHLWTHLEFYQGKNKRTQRAYDFTGVTSWFAAKCDLILLLFDPHKLDVSDEFKRVISSLRGHDDKIRVVLNKADQVDTQQLMRVYGALMWSLGKVVNTPEVVRVYIGSFNDKPVNEAAVGPIGKELFEKEQDDLLSDLKDIPKKACDRRINEFVKRARAAKIHAYIISHLKKEMPAMMGKAKAQQRLIDNLADEFGKVQREFHLPPGDFPNVEHFREVLSGYSIDKFEKLKPKMIQAVDDMLGYDIPELLKNFRNPYD
ncbi:hypothetical protein GH714_023667 [Hevea brasiliensis]|uniref:EH domain-containing protein n=1 Tax=Hevea brasiliensis TaxID=3981 RepID=A0A6A6LQW2_HEVBR|nr:hypothetical protein GH714_023667 [Hevea brasiliensis]